MIRDIQCYWKEQDKPKLKKVEEKYDISQAAAKKYLVMSELEIAALDSPADYKKRYSPMNDWLNVIFKMMDDGHSNETIYYYILRQENFKENGRKLESYIYLIGKNNFPSRAPFNSKYLMEWVMPPEVIVINRTDLLKYILTCNPKTKKDETIGKYIEQIKVLAVIS